ncbi:MAG: protein phosphatase 2C domain-containing protein [Gemmatimonadota bacterium]
MGIAKMLTLAATPAVSGRPRDEELDLFGLTHPGKVRSENQDHFLLCTVHQQMVVHETSLPNPDKLPLRGQRMGTIMLVADGVGGSHSGGEASQLAAETITRYVSGTMSCFHASGGGEEKEFFAALKSAAMEAHNAVRAESSNRPGEKRMATTLTVGVAVWPRMYIVQVGDSRCYHYWDGKLRQVTRDQTVAQYLVDVGALPPEQAATSPFTNVLASAIGGEEASPEVLRLDIAQRGCVVLLCTDGLTKHVSDDEIAEHLRTMQSSESVSRALLDLALDRGGTDNITILIGRANRADPANL